MRKNQGFTLIELIAVIAILAILAATAIPQFVDLRAQARTAALNGVAGGLASAAALNYAARVATNNVSGSAVVDCQDLRNLVSTANIGITTPTAGSNGYSIDSVALTPAGKIASCTLHNDSGQTATFQGIGA